MAVGKLDWTHSMLDALQTTKSHACSAKVADCLVQKLQAGELPFLSMPYMDGLLEELQGFAPKLKRFQHMLLLGIGGSALGAKALQQTFAPQQERAEYQGPWLWIADNVDSARLKHQLENLVAEQTVLVVVSKSGGTIETIGQYFFFKQWLQDACGEGWREHVFCITDSNSGFLREEVSQHGLMSLPVPESLGGRYSVLSAVGLMPALFLGLDIENLVRGARDFAAPLLASHVSQKSLEEHPAFQLAVWNATLMEQGYDELIFFSYIPKMSGFGHWFAQLWAESLGKNGKGSQPIPAIGVTDQHSVNQMFLDGPRNKACLFLTCSSHARQPRFPNNIPDSFSYIRGKSFNELLQAEQIGTQMALCESKVPLVEIRLHEVNEYTLGSMILLLATTTLFTAWLLDINPLDQPAVELGKRLAKARLGASGFEQEQVALSAFMQKKGKEQEF